MKAVRVLEYGGQLVFADVLMPTIARDEILVKIKNTAVNHLDLVKASGTVRQILPIDLPWIPGHEFSGTVEQVGGDVAAFTQVMRVRNQPIGRVCGVSRRHAGDRRKEATQPLLRGGGVSTGGRPNGVAGHLHARSLEKGQTILIHGGAGAVGRLCGATGIACRCHRHCHGKWRDEAYLKAIGAGRVVDYRKAQFEKVLREKVDVVFDLVGGDTQQRSFLVLKEGGHLVAATQPVSQEETARHHVSGAMMRLAPSADVLSRIARLLEEGTVSARRRGRV